MSKGVEQSSSSASSRKHQNFYQKTYTFSDILKFRSKLELDEEKEHENDESNRVLFQNVRVIANQINRRPQYVMKFLAHCLQRTCYYNANRSVGVILPNQPLPQHQQHQLKQEINFEDLRGTQDVVNKHLHAYVKKYVQCPACSCLQTLNPISQDNEDQAEEEFTFCISCRGCSAVTPLDVMDDPFLQDIADSRNRNAEKVLKQKRLQEGRNYDTQLVDGMGFYTARNGPTYYHQVNGTTYFDVPPPSSGPEMFYQNYFPPMAPPMYGTPYGFNGVPYPFVQGFNPYGPELEQLPHEEGMYTSDALEKEVFEKQNLTQPEYTPGEYSQVEHNIFYGIPAYHMYDPSLPVPQMVNNDNHEQLEQKAAESTTSSDKESIEAVYKSAGILPYSIHPKTKRLVFLLGKELRGGNQNPVKNRSTWSEFGGKKEKKDRDSIETACRKFCEQTVGVFRGENFTAKTPLNISKEKFLQSINYMQDILRSLNEEELKSYSSYYVPGKYRLFLVRVPYIDTEILAKGYEENKQKKVIPDSPKQIFKWIEAGSLFTLICGQKKKNEKSKAVSDLGLLQFSPGEELHPFFVNLFRNCKPVIDQLIKEHNSSESVSSGIGNRSNGH